MNGFALAAAVFPLIAAYGAFSDLFTYKIPNTFIIAAALAFFAAAYPAGFEAEKFLRHGVCGLGVLVAGFALFARGWIGGGDAKFAAVIALWLGTEGLYDFLVITTLAGAGLAIFLLAMRRAPKVIHRPPQWLARLSNPREGAPYGVAMAIAGVIVYSNSSIAQQLLMLAV
jgi:prepilin peptidase CpaA